MNPHLHRACSWALRHLVPESAWPRTVDVDGVAIRLRDTPYSFSTRRLIKNGAYELPERTLVNKAITPGMRVIEFGGSIGIVTAVTAHRVGPSGRVVSVEASPALSDYSRTWLEKGGNVKVLTGYAFPVWELPAGLRVNAFEGAEVSLGGRVSFSVNGSAGAMPPSSDSGVPRSYDLSTIAREHSIDPDALVMDIEAAERVIVDQPPRYPASLRVIIAELHPTMYPKGQSDLDAILAAWAREGFRVVEQVHNSWLLTR